MGNIVHSLNTSGMLSAVMSIEFASSAVGQSAEVVKPIIHHKPNSIILGKNTEPAYNLAISTTTLNPILLLTRDTSLTGVKHQFHMLQHFGYVLGLAGLLVRT